VGLAQGSSEELEEQVDETELVEEHTKQGEQVMPWSISLAVAAAAINAIPVLARRRRTLPARTVTAAVGAASLVAGAGATWTVIDVGKCGARATWDDVRGRRLRAGMASRRRRWPADARSGRVVSSRTAWSTRPSATPGGATSPGAVPDVLDRYLDAGVGFCQMAVWRHGRGEASASVTFFASTGWRRLRSRPASGAMLAVGTA
jgi:hypothetical protein